MEYILSAIGLPSLGLSKSLGDFFRRFTQHIHDHFIPHARNNYHPHILGHRALGLFSGLLVTVKIFTIALVAFGPVLPAFSSAITIDNIISLTNESRQQYGFSGLAQNSVLDQAAQAKADDMLARGYFAHNTPDGRTPWSFITAAGYNYLMAGENLAVNFTDAESVQTAWMNSPGHKANILNKNFEDIGIGISQGEYQGHAAIFVVQEFGTPAEQQVTLTQKPTTVQPAAVPAPIAKAPVPAKVQASPVVVKAPVQTFAAPNQVLSANQNQAAAAAPVPEPPKLVSGDVKLNGDRVNITAEVTGPAVKVLAYFGQEAIMLLPKDQTTWEGSVALSALSQSAVSVNLKAFSIDGQTDQLQLADFAPSTVSNYNLAGTTPTSYVTWLGHTFDPKSAESRFYLLVIAGLLSSMVLAIGLKRHVQHLSLIANSSFVVILACMLWMGG